jgi:hypothetical protein
MYIIYIIHRSVAAPHLPARLNHNKTSEEHGAFAAKKKRDTAQKNREGTLEGRRETEPAGREGGRGGYALGAGRGGDWQQFGNEFGQVECVHAYMSRWQVCILVVE